MVAVWLSALTYLTDLLMVCRLYDPYVRDVLQWEKQKNTVEYRTGECFSRMYGGK